MKKLVSLIIASAIILSVSGCSGSNAAEAPAPSTTTTAASVTTPVESEKTTDTEATETIAQEDETEPVEETTAETTEATTTTQATTTTVKTTEATTKKPVETTEATTKKPVETTEATTKKPVETTEATTKKPVETTAATTTKAIETEPENNIPSGTASGKSIVDDYKSKYAYNTLTSAQKELYSRLYEAIASHTATIDVSSLGVNSTDLQKAFYSLACDNHQFFWLGGGYENTYNSGTGAILTVSPVYTRTKSESEKIQKELDAVTATVTANAMKKSTLFEQVLYLHDYVVNNTTYTTSGDESISEADGPLLNGYALCEGYSNAFGYLCQLIGVETVDVVGSAGGGDHMWNIVKLGGKWYQFDVTFDDPKATTPILSHDYFAITTAKIKQDHTFNTSFFPLPDCTATEYNYYTAMSITVYTDASKAYDALIKKAAANFKKGVYATEIICTVECIETLWGSKYKENIFTDLASYGCSPSSYKRNYKGTTFTLTLTP